MEEKHPLVNFTALGVRAESSFSENCVLEGQGVIMLRMEEPLTL